MNLKKRKKKKRKSKSRIFEYRSEGKSLWDKTSDEKHKNCFKLSNDIATTTSVTIKIEWKCDKLQNSSINNSIAGGSVMLVNTLQTTTNSNTQNEFMQFFFSVNCELGRRKRERATFFTFDLHLFQCAQANLIEESSSSWVSFSVYR